MFTNKLNTPKSRPVPFSSPTPNKQRRSLNIFSQGQAKRSPFTPSSRNQSFNKSVLQTSQANEDSTQHRLEPYGNTLSVLITEAITLADSSASLDVCLGRSGWAWLVIGRRLFVWKYKPSPISKTSICKELVLPSSSISFTSAMVTVVPSGDQHTLPACIAISPDGTVRCWHSISHEASYLEVSTEVKGHQCVAVITLESTPSCIIATNNSRLFLLSFTSHTSLNCRELSTPHGMLSGISRRVSSMFFGGGSQASDGPKLHRILSGEEMDDGSASFYVLSGDNVEKWTIQGDSEKLLYQCEAGRLMKECVAASIWKQDHKCMAELRTWLIDMQTTGDGLVIFGAAVNPEVSDQLHYVLGTLHTEGVNPPQSFLSFAVQKFSNSYQLLHEASLLDYNLLIADAIGSSAYIYNKKTVICTSVTSTAQALDQVDFSTSGDMIIGAGVCDRMALFFSLSHGLVSIQQNIHDTESTLNESKFEAATPRSNELNVLLTQSKVEELSVSEDKTTRLKAAFIQSSRGNQEQSSAIIAELLTLSNQTTSGDTSLLDSLVVSLSQQLIDDFPAADPRWAESIPHDAASSTSSLILLRQLQDKLKSHQIYINFLKTSSLWDRLGCVRVRNTLMCTSLMLCEHAEKITSTIALRSLHGQYTQAIDKAIYTVLSNRGETTPPSGLTPQDLFYRQVSRMHDILDIIQQQQDDTLVTDIPPTETVKLIKAVNDIFIGVLSEGVQYRESQSSAFTPTVPESTLVDYLPWTASTGPHGVRTLITKQYELTVQRAVPLCQDAAERGNVCEQMLQLGDLLLDGFCVQLQKLRSETQAVKYQELTDMYQQQRRAIIQPLMNFEQYERAASLAEKYCEFDILIQLCEQTNNTERLTRYLNQFHNRNFAEFVFSWYVKQGKRSKLLSPPLASHPQLSKFLRTSESHFISWVHDLGNNDYLQAYETLEKLALKEVDNLAKKKTLYSLSKLCALAADDAPNDLPDRIEGINKAHDLILQQEALPSEVVENLGMDSDNMKVMEPAELIELYIGDLNPHSNEFDFKKALDLLPSLNKPSTDASYAEMLLHIWCRAILKDNWTDLSLTEPLESCKETIFFKTVELAFIQGMDLGSYLPSVDTILQSEELSSIHDDTTFQFLIKAGYEKLQISLE